MGLEKYFKKTGIVGQNTKTTYDYFGSKLNEGDKIVFAMIGAECCTKTPPEWESDDNKPELCYKLEMVKFDNINQLENFKFKSHLDEVPVFLKS